MRDKKELEELISAYVLGALDGDELKEVEDILASGSKDAELILREYEEVKNHLSYSSKGRMPEPELRKKMLSEILGPKELPKAQSSPPFWSRFWNLGLSLGGAVAVGAILLLFISNHSLKQELQLESTRIAELESTISDQDKKINSLRARIEDKESEVADLKDSYAKLDELTEFLEDPDVFVIKFSNLHENSDAGSGILVDHKDDKALFYCLDLHEPPEGKDYQFWVKADGVHKSISVFKVDQMGSHIVNLGSISDLGDIQSYTVTLEPAGGAEKPSGKMLFAGDHVGASL